MVQSVGLHNNDLLNLAIAAHYAEIKDAVRRRGHTQDAASDIVHDLYLKLVDRPDALADRRSLRAFLCRAAINLGIDRMRRARFEQRLFRGSETEATAVAAETHAPDHGLEVEARLTILKTAIGELPSRQRAVFILHRLHQMTPDSIAQRLCISRNMVDRHLRRALAHCLDRLTEIG